ncbi:tRNA pseudouridine synthase A [Neisseria gonorrhoeae]|uniref:tRNA pseudouridine synthase A n=1 Tax=Neisseria gonorrhoeae TaxID=485 RepID=UPI001E3319C3|nr:tRNA pseudouridine(38-40) synthase TruA [Neisseria gonorrhoeae]
MPTCPKALPFCTPDRSHPDFTPASTHTDGTTATCSNPPRPFPLLKNRAGWTHLKLDIEPMRRAAALLIGEQDFSSFRAAGCQAKSPSKPSTGSTYPKRRTDPPRFARQRLLHHMVRNIMGALVYVGSGRLSVEGFAALIQERSRLKAPPTFMPDGLYLTGVDYPGHTASSAPNPRMALKHSCRGDFEIGQTVRQSFQC